jgi:prolipoprotein diacylglyceryltransferase
MINWFKFEYLFSNNLWPITTNVFNMAVGVYVLVFVMAIIFTFFRKKKALAKPYKKLMQKFSNWCFTFSIIGLILMFFRHQLIPYLGMRAWSMIWFVVCIAWLVYILRYLFVNIPKQKQDKKIREEFEKYLP